MIVTDPDSFIVDQVQPKVLVTQNQCCSIGVAGITNLSEFPACFLDERLVISIDYTCLEQDWPVGGLYLFLCHIRQCVK